MVIKDDFQFNVIILGMIYYLSIMLTPSVLSLPFAGLNLRGFRDCPRF